MNREIEAEKGDVIRVGRRKYHVTSTRNGSVYGHAIKHCDDAGCAGDEHFLGAKRDGRQDNGPVDQGLKEAKKLITGPRELFDAVSARAAELGIKPAEAWRRAAREWLASADPGQ